MPNDVAILEQPQSRIHDWISWFKKKNGQKWIEISQNPNES